MKQKRHNLVMKRSTRLTEKEDKDIMQYAENNELTYSAALRKLALESLYK
ncbi:hypothetical protein H7K20_12620 [Priestia aryabhattai]|nr:MULTISPECIES: hypothetical protein [Priestia]MBY0027945.1 hypothetical protein [Priestia aryabhattai]MCU7711128.1 hypothetical protein [Priestia megaterium]MCW1044145.1 hypothetical protein [Priestia sp. JV24]